MSIRTTEDLSDVLSDDLAWRKKELSEVKALVETKNISNQRHKALVRSGVCILSEGVTSTPKTLSRIDLTE